MLKEYFYGGHAIFTVSSPREHYTYKVSNLELSDKTLHFVYLLTGPDNESDYTYVGMLTNTVILTKKSKFLPDSKPFRVVKWALDLVLNNREFPEGYALRHNGTCGKCGRTLTTPESIELGIGPICRNK